MRSVVICGSRRFKKEMQEFASQLKQAGVVVYEPILAEFDHGELSAFSEQIRGLIFYALGWHHLEQITKADVCFIYNKDGYIGSSVSVEMGFVKGYCLASGRGMLIYSLEPDPDLARGQLIDEVVPNLEELLKRL